MKKTYIVILGIIVFLLLAVLVIYFLNNRFQQNQIRFNPQVIGVKTELDNPQVVSAALAEASVINNENIKNVEITFVSENPNPMFVEQDTEGNVIISSGFTVDNKGDVQVTIYVSDFVKQMEPQRQTNIINNYFWKVADLIATRNLGSIPLNPVRPPIFIPK